MQEESGIPPSNKHLNKTLKFIKAVALFQVIKDIEFALLHGISYRHYLGYKSFVLHYKVSGLLLNIYVFT